LPGAPDRIRNACPTPKQGPGDTVALAQALKVRGIDLVDCSSGGMSGPATLSTAKITPGYLVPYAAAVRKEADLPTMAVGAILDPRQAEAILAAGDADRSCQNQATREDERC
jgi:2,4-dienoyl-CoA reductase-like NADH-dependent reductase (Old Yellow Enzyme family)